jgi:hypothetical protein
MVVISGKPCAYRRDVATAAAWPNGPDLARFLSVWASKIVPPRGRPLVHWPWEAGTKGHEASGLATLMERLNSPEGVGYR